MVTNVSYLYIYIYIYICVCVYVNGGMCKLYPVHMNQYWQYMVSARDGKYGI